MYKLHVEYLVQFTFSTISIRSECVIIREILTGVGVAFLELLKKSRCVSFDHALIYKEFAR